MDENDPEESHSKAEFGIFKATSQGFCYCTEGSVNLSIFNENGTPFLNVSVHGSV